MRWRLLMSMGGVTPGVGRSSHGPIPAVIKEGFDPQTKTETISEAKLAGKHKETFWDTLESQGAEKLIITCKNGKTVTYEKGFFNRLLENKPDLADLTHFVTVEFSDGSEQEKTKAMLLMCGTTLENLFEVLEFPSISLTEISSEDFQGVMHAIENEVVDIISYSEGVQLAMEYLDFHPAGVGVHGRRDWNARGIDVGEVPPLPKELLKALNQPCPIAKDGSKMIDTHVILWMPPTLNGAPITVNTLEEMATSAEFGKNKIGYESCDSAIRTDAVINQGLEKGYWLVLYKKPIAEGQSYEKKQQYITDNCPGYEMPKTRETIACCLMQYGCSGDKKERILAREDEVRYSTSEERVGGLQVVVGGLDSSGFRVRKHYGDFNYIGVCPVRRFI
jgi:hypothetical protein